MHGANPRQRIRVAPEARDVLAITGAVDGVFADGLGVRNRVGPEVRLRFVQGAAFGRAFEAGDGRRDRVHALVITDGAVFGRIVQEIAVAVNGRVDDDLLRAGGRVNGLDDGQREGVVEAQGRAQKRVR